MYAKKPFSIEVNFVYNESEALDGLYTEPRVYGSLESGKRFPTDNGNTLAAQQSWMKEECCSSESPPNNSCSFGRKWID